MASCSRVSANLSGVTIPIVSLLLLVPCKQAMITEPSSHCVFAASFTGSVTVLRPAHSSRYNKTRMTSLPLPLAAFVAGLVSFLSPCVLPLVPGYVSLISGVGVEELKTQESQLLRKVMLNSLAFILGF